MSVTETAPRAPTAVLAILSCTCLLGHSSLLTAVFPFAYRCVLHRHFVVLVEGLCYHPGQLSAPVRSQVPAETVLPAQLLEAHVVGVRWPKARRSRAVLADRVQVAFFLTASCGSCSNR